MVEQLDQKHGRFKWYFMKDGAPAHNAFMTSEFLAERRLVLSEWPPNSPDLNPIGMVWGIVKALKN
jgi:transposase